MQQARGKIKSKLEAWWSKLRTVRKSPVEPSRMQPSQLPEGIKVIKQNTTRPLAMYKIPCSRCGHNVRASAVFCPNCGISLTLPRVMPKSTIPLQPDAIEPVKVMIPAISGNSELNEGISEIVHIDLMLKVKLYLLWDKAGR